MIDASQIIANIGSKLEKRKHTACDYHSSYPLLSDWLHYLANLDPGLEEDSHDDSKYQPKSQLYIVVDQRLTVFDFRCSFSAEHCDCDGQK
jgi:hypothetical protein